MSAPTVSLIIPTYNRAEYLKEALESALQQTYDSLEVIVIDDASLDDTSLTVSELVDERVRYIRQPANQGPNSNWRAGMKAASGLLYGFLADDDILQPTYVERMAAPLLDNRNLTLSFCDHWVMDAAGHQDQSATARNTQQYGRDCLSGGMITAPAQPLLIAESAYIGAVLFRRDHVPPSFLQPPARSAMGGWILYQCVKTGRPVYYIPERLMQCRWQKGSVSRSQRWRDAMTEGNINRLRLMIDDPILKPYRADLEEQLAVNLGTRGRLHLIDGERKEARQLLAESFQLRPTWRTATAYALALGGPVGTTLARKLRRLSGNG